MGERRMLVNVSSNNASVADSVTFNGPEDMDNVYNLTAEIVATNKYLSPMTGQKNIFARALRGTTMPEIHKRREACLVSMLEDITAVQQLDAFTASLVTRLKAIMFLPIYNSLGIELATLSSLIAEVELLQDMIQYASNPSILINLIMRAMVDIPVLLYWDLVKLARNGVTENNHS